MIQPTWIDIDSIHLFHDAQIERHGGSYGIRDNNLLESALGRPQNIHAYNQGNMFDMASAYAYGIAKNHPFVDGNKRTALITSILFLELNGYVFTASEAEAVHMIISLANGEIEEKLYAIWLQQNSQEK
jgi:death on curing protein